MGPDVNRKTLERVFNPEALRTKFEKLGLAYFTKKSEIYRYDFQASIPDLMEEIVDCVTEEIDKWPVDKTYIITQIFRAAFFKVSQLAPGNRIQDWIAEGPRFLSKIILAMKKNIEEDKPEPLPSEMTDVIDAIHGVGAGI